MGPFIVRGAARHNYTIKQVIHVPWWSFQQCFPNSVLGTPKGAHFVFCPSTTQLIQIINSSLSFYHLNHLCSTGGKNQNLHPLGFPGLSLGNTVLMKSGTHQNHLSYSGLNLLSNLLIVKPQYTLNSFNHCIDLNILLVISIVVWT